MTDEVMYHYESEEQVKMFGTIYNLEDYMFDGFVDTIAKELRDPYKVMLYEALERAIKDAG